MKPAPRIGGTARRVAVDDDDDAMSATSTTSFDARTGLVGPVRPPDPTVPYPENVTTALS